MSHYRKRINSLDQTAQNISFSRKKPSVQHRLEYARKRNPLRPDLDRLLSNHNLENSYEELTQDFSQLDLESDGTDLKDFNDDDNNNNKMPSTPDLLKVVRPTEMTSKAQVTADELFFRLSRGIRILPEGLPGPRGMVTPLCDKYNELKEQMNKYCVIPPPWTDKQLKALPECICYRNVLYSRCKNCGHIMKGRVYKNCERHPGIAFLLDYFLCYECLAETDQLIEL